MIPVIKKIVIITITLFIMKLLFFSTGKSSFKKKFNLKDFSGKKRIFIFYVILKGDLYG